jgi:hypothetical protein
MKGSWDLVVGHGRSGNRERPHQLAARSVYKLWQGPMVGYMAGGVEVGIGIRRPYPRRR